MLYKRGGIWWIKLKWNRRLIRVSTHTSNRQLAKKIEVKVSNELVEDNWGILSRKYTISEMITRYEAEYTIKKKFLARDRRIFKHLSNFFGAPTLLQDIEQMAGEYETQRANQGAMPATILKELGLLRRMLNLARKKWKWLKDNPLSSLDLPRVKNDRVRFLTADEFTRLLPVLDDAMTPRWLKPIVIIGLNTGLREGNLLELKWPQVNLLSRSITIAGEYMKNQETIGIPLVEWPVEIFREIEKIKHIEGYVFHDNGRIVYPGKLQRAFRKACKLAAIEDFRFHDLRHTFASYLIQNGVPLHIIAKLLGHKDTRSVQRYAHLSIENLREAVSVLNVLREAQKGAQSDVQHAANEA